ncbi:MAG TPA: hypothetical protein VIL53_06080 [Solirubrobacterales bacterium]
MLFWHCDVEQLAALAVDLQGGVLDAEAAMRESFHVEECGVAVVLAPDENVG